MTLELVILVPDKDIEQTIHHLLSRPASVGMRPLRSFKLISHPGHDPGVYHTGHNLLRAFEGEAECALVLLDLAWDGVPSQDPARIESDVEATCHAVWGDRCRCVCIAPEVETWVWSDSPHVAKALGWSSLSELREWLAREKLWPEGLSKPPDPKQAFEHAARHRRVVASSSIFGRLAREVSFRRCQDRAFLRLLDILRSWFPLQ